jgi:LmbE family N-acetylglucosaminyl deacetylase
LLLFEADEADHLEDVTGFVDAKLAALLEHRSQFRSTMGIAGTGAGGSATRDEDSENPEVVDFKRRVSDRLAEHGRKGDFAAAEPFKRIDDL